MMTDKELIRRALIGDREARDLCTNKGVAIPCPICGKEDCIEILDCYTAEGLKSEGESFRKDSFKCVCNYLKGGCGTSTGVSKTKQEALYKWNTRPAPPVGRCGECKSYTALGHCKLHSQEPDQHDTGAYVEMLPDDFCSYFEPKED